MIDLKADKILRASKRWKRPQRNGERLPEGEAMLPVFAVAVDYSADERTFLHKANE